MIKHAPHHKPKSHRLWLSEDNQYVWWQPVADKGPPAAQFLVSDIHIILSYPPERLVETARIPGCFMLVFDLGQTAGDAEICATVKAGKLMIWKPKKAEATSYVKKLMSLLTVDVSQFQ